MEGPFAGHGIRLSGSLEDEPLAADPYVRLLLQHLRDDSLFRSISENTRARQQSLLRPFLDFFLRHDRDSYYCSLFKRKGLLDESSPRLSVRKDVVLEDLVRLRIHSDDLRGNGQTRRLIREIDPNSPPKGTQVHRSSGTTENATGPVTILRSPLTIRLMRLVNGGLIKWSLGRTSTGGVCMLQLAPEMTDFVTFASFAADVMQELGSRIIFGNSLRESSDEQNVWRRLKPDMRAMRSFFACREAPKILVTGSAGLFATVANPDMMKRAAIKLFLGLPPIDLGEGGVLMTGGGLKRVPSRYKSMREMVCSVAHTVTSTVGGRKVRAPFMDYLGLTESASVFVNKAADPFEETAWIKYPHPLSFVTTLESPKKLSPSSSDDFEKPGLFFFVNLACLDYLEAVISGDFVRRVRTPDQPQHGFIYERRADISEGFEAREGCG
jgi:hypothetical protein